MRRNKTIFTILFLILLNSIIRNSFSREIVKKSNKNKEVFDIFVEEQNQYKILKSKFNQSAIIIRRHNNQSMRIILPSNLEFEFVQFLKEYGMKYQKLLLGKNKFEHHVSKRGVPESFITFRRYYRYDDIQRYMNFLAENYPDLAKVTNVGKSYEGRDLNALYISLNANESEPKISKPLVLIDAGIHAREWIAPATALYTMQELVENSNFYKTELILFDWIVLPLVNPDGYEYSHEKDRLWRKNRRPSTEDKPQCIGTDLNRNFDYKWGVSGSSKNPCSITFGGPTSFSEPESVALRDLMLSVNSSCFMYLTLHSYGNYILYPWGYNRDKPNGWEHLDNIAKIGADKIKRSTGTKYTIGPSGKVLYPSAGGSDDYAYAEVNIPVVFCMELPSGGSKFDPPPKQILPIVSESWVGIRTLAVEAYTNTMRSSASFCKLNVIIILMLMKLFF